MKKIPPFKLVPEPLDESAATMPKFKWASPDIGTRHKLGGVPDFIQEEEPYPKCVACENEMTFFAQLDSLNDEFCIADCGMVYVFMCFDCCEVSTIVQYH